MKADLRVVIDTNVLISATLLRPSVPAQVVTAVLKRGRVLFSEATFAEFETRLRRRKFDRYLPVEVRRSLLRDWEAVAEWIERPGRHLEPAAIRESSHLFRVLVLASHALTRTAS